MPSKYVVHLNRVGPRDASKDGTPECDVMAIDMERHYSQEFPPATQMGQVQMFPSPDGKVMHLAVACYQDRVFSGLAFSQALASLDVPPEETIAFDLEAYPSCRKTVHVVIMTMLAASPRRFAVYCAPSFG